MEAKDIMSVLQHLLRSNVVPLEGEAELVRTVIVPQMLQEAHLVERYNRHQLDFKHIKGQVDFYKASAALWMSTLSVIRRIPADILVEIFLLLEPQDSATGGEQQRERHARALPWNVSHVCRHWRWTAISTPSLWRRLPVIDLRVSVAPDAIEHHLALFRELIKRSNYSQLDVSIYSPDSSPNHPLLKFIADYSDVWVSLSIESTFFTINGLKHIKGSLPVLTNLELKFVETTLPYIVHKLEMFADAPALRTVSIKGKYPGKIILPHRQLGCIRDDTEWVPRALGYVSTAYQNLTELSMWEMNYPENPEGPYNLPVLRFPCLKELRVVTIVDGGVNFLKMAICPVLRVLYIRPLRNIGNVYRAIGLFIMRSNCHMTIADITIEERAPIPRPGLLSELLRVTPNLEVLHTALPSEQELLVLSEPNHGNWVFLPQLRSCLFFVHEEMEQALVDAVYALAYRRWPETCGHLYLMSYESPQRRFYFAACHRVLEPHIADTEENVLAFLHDQVVEHIVSVTRAGFDDFEGPPMSQFVSILLAIEDYPETTIGHILASNLHIILSRMLMTYNSPDQPEDDDVFHLLLRTLQKWRPFFQEVAPKLRWVRSSGPTTLMFVPEGCQCGCRNATHFVDTIMGLTADHPFDTCPHPSVLQGRYMLKSR